MPFPPDCARALDPPDLRPADDELFFAVLLAAEDRELDDLPFDLERDAADLPPDFAPDLVPPELARDELEEREPVLFLAVDDLLEDDRLDDPPDDFADEDLDFDPALDEREELDPDFDDFEAPDLDDADLDDPDLDPPDVDDPDLDDPDFEDRDPDDLDEPPLEDFDEPDLDEDPDFEPVDFFVVGIFVSSGIYRCVFEYVRVRVFANCVPSIKSNRSAT